MAPISELGSLSRTVPLLNNLTPSTHSPLYDWGLPQSTDLSLLPQSLTSAASASAEAMAPPTPVFLFPRQSPTSIDDVNNEGGSDSDDNRGIMNYYFVFFALLVCIAGLCAYFVWRRRKAALQIYQNHQNSAFPQSVSREWDNMRYRRRYWNNNGFRTAQASREEGLDENGEAPPPYMPKDDQATDNNGASQAGGPNTQGQARPGEPAIPMQALSREQAGLKPPDYEQTVQPNGSGASGSRPAN